MGRGAGGRVVRGPWGPYPGGMVSKAEGQGARSIAGPVAGRWRLVGGEVVQGTPAEAVRAMRVRAFGCPHGTSGPLGPYCAWVAGRMGAQVSEQAGDDEAAQALLELLVLRGHAVSEPGQVVSLGERRRLR